MKIRVRNILLASAITLAASPALSENAAIEPMQDYMEFAAYEGGIILPEQLTKEAFDDFAFIDTRNAELYSAGTIKGAKHIEWREVLGRIDEIPTDKKVILFCNTGSLSAQAFFALRVAGRENVLLLQTGYLGWQENAPYKP